MRHGESRNHEEIPREMKLAGHIRKDMGVCGPWSPLVLVQKVLMGKTGILIPKVGNTIVC